MQQKAKDNRAAQRISKAQKVNFCVNIIFVYVLYVYTYVCKHFSF